MREFSAPLPEFLDDSLAAEPCLKPPLLRLPSPEIAESGLPLIEDLISGNWLSDWFYWLLWLSKFFLKSPWFSFVSLVKKSMVSLAWASSSVNFLTYSLSCSIILALGSSFLIGLLEM